MEHIGFEALYALLILLPGFLTAWIVHSFCSRPVQTELDKVVEALLYSFFIYTAFVTFFKRVPLAIVENTSSGGSHTYSPNLYPRIFLRFS